MNARPMLRSVLASALLIGAVSATGTPATTVVGRSLAPAPQSRVQATAAIDDATAAALIGAISSQFGARAVQVQLGAVHIDPAGIVQRSVHGTGRLRIGRDPSWIAFQFRALYDTEQVAVAGPELTLGGGEPQQVVGRNAPVARALGEAVGKRLHQEFAQQPATFRLDHVRSAPAGNAYVRLDATGIASFGTDGQTPAHVRALYDPRSGEWLQLAYDLGVDHTSS